MNDQEIGRVSVSESVVDARQRLRSLTQREFEVIRLICSGKPLREVATILALAHNTVDNHKSSAYRKLGVHSLTQLMLWALEAGVIGAGPESSVPLVIGAAEQPITHA